MIEDLGVKTVRNSQSDYHISEIEAIAAQFQIPKALHVAPFPGRGNINLHTYELIAGGDEFLLQKVNSDVFTMPDRVMNSMMRVIEAQVSYLEANGNAHNWVPVTLVSTLDGKPYLEITDERGLSVWRMMPRIAHSIGYKSLSQANTRTDQLRLAQEVGRGFAIYTDLTSQVDPRQVLGSLPGYRDTDLYYRQFESVLAGNRSLEEAEPLLPSDPILRKATEQQFIVHLPDSEFKSRLNDPDLVPWIEKLLDRKPIAMSLWNALEAGHIRPSLIHGDTKIENFLFCSKTGRVKSLVDLDTIMAFTWLADWGDMVRSLVNVAGECEEDLSKVQVDDQIYNAVARGFLETARNVSQEEIDLMPRAVEAIALELGLRFLTDYLRGDNYFQLGPADPPRLNKIRALVQLNLYEQLMKFRSLAETLIAGHWHAPCN
jgi:hypothetical protein